MSNKWVALPQTYPCCLLVVPVLYPAVDFPVRGEVPPLPAVSFTAQQVSFPLSVPVSLHLINSPHNWLCISCLALGHKPGSALRGCWGLGLANTRDHTDHTDHAEPHHCSPGTALNIAFFKLLPWSYVQKVRIF